MSNWKLCLYLCVLSLISSDSMGQVYRCDGADGRKIFSNTPCGNDARAMSHEELTPNSGGSLGVSRHSNLRTNTSDPSFSQRQDSNPRPIDSQLITSRYDELSRIVTRLVGVENSKPYQQRIHANRTRALRATRINANASQINARFDAQLEEIRRIHLGNHSRMASEWIRVEAERDTALFGLPPISR